MHETPEESCPWPPCCWSWHGHHRKLSGQHCTSFWQHSSELLTGRSLLFFHGDLFFYSALDTECLHVGGFSIWMIYILKHRAVKNVECYICGCMFKFLTWQLSLQHSYISVIVALTAACFSDAMENLKQSPQMNNAWATADNTLALSAVVLSICNHGDFLASEHCFLSDCFFSPGEWASRFPSGEQALESSVVQQQPQSIRVWKGKRWGGFAQQLPCS